MPLRFLRPTAFALLLAKRALTASAVLAVSFPDNASAQWQPNGAPVCVCPFIQTTHVVAPDGDGGAFVAWRDGRNLSSSGADVYVQHLTASGAIAAGWPSDGLPVCMEPNSQYPSALVADGQGGVIVVWVDSRDGFATLWDIYAQHLTPGGQIAAGWPAKGLALCSMPEEQSMAQAVPDGAGGAIVTWRDFRNGDSGYIVNSDVYATRVTGAGAIAPGWPEQGLPVCTADGNQWGLAVSDGAGGAIVAWNDERGGGTATYAQRLTGDGKIAAGAWQPNGIPLCDTPGGCAVVGICTDGDSGSYITWTDTRTAGGDPRWYYYADIYAQRVRGDGTIAAGWPEDGFPACDVFQAQMAPVICPDGAGGCLIAWQDLRDLIERTYAIRLLGTAEVAPGWPEDGRPVSDAPGYQALPQIVEDGMGGAFVALENLGDDPACKVVVQHLTGAGAIAAGWDGDGLRIAQTGGYQENPRFVSSGLGAIVVWEDGRNPIPAGSDLYAQRLVADGPVATLMSLVAVEARPGEVTLIWHAAGSLEGPATVERRSGEPAWQPLATVFADGSGRIEHRDAGVVAGERYGYRLTYMSEGRRSVTPEVWVDVPAEPRLALEGLRPSPASGEALAWFTLGSGEPATLEMLDLSGRRVLAREVGGLGAGRHAVRLDLSALGPGVYWIRLRQGAQARVRRAVVLE
jgi:hypothetical protein